MARGKLHLTLGLVLLSLAASPAMAQVIPAPGAGRPLVIHDRDGKLVERLQPDDGHYEVFDAQHGFIPAGRAEMRGQRLILYDRNGHIVATARPELLPPDAPLSEITIVRNRNGEPIGTLGRY